jgi:hypothetical protein
MRRMAKDHHVAYMINRRTVLLDVSKDNRWQYFLHGKVFNYLTTVINCSCSGMAHCKKFFCFMCTQVPIHRFMTRNSWQSSARWHLTYCHTLRLEWVADTPVFTMLTIFSWFLGRVWYQQGSRGRVFWEIHAVYWGHL